MIKGVASALYGAGALGGVVDLISRRPAKEPCAKRSSIDDAAAAPMPSLFAAQPLTERWSGTLLVGGHWQERNDVDGDGWADLAGYRAVSCVRGFSGMTAAGRSLFVTGGVDVGAA